MQVDRRGTVLWQWIHDALTAQGYTSDSTLGLDSLHGMFSPMEYAVPATNTRLLVRAILIGNKFMLHCERHDGMTTTWRVDFPLKAYIPADPALYPKHREYVVWRVQKDIVDHGTASIQANLVAMPDHARNLALSFLDAKSLVQVRGACQILAKSSMEPSLWQQHLQREFPQLVHDIGGANAFPAYVNAFQRRKERRLMLLRQQLMHHEEVFFPWERHELMPRFPLSGNAFVPPLPRPTTDLFRRQFPF